MNLIELGLALQAARKQAKLSQTELAARADVSRSRISQLENGALPDMGISRVMDLALQLGFELSLIPKRAKPNLRDMAIRDVT
jgi:HTH-type transcriptional regulator / antitoxin HipB